MEPLNRFFIPHHPSKRIFKGALAIGDLHKELSSQNPKNLRVFSAIETFVATDSSEDEVLQLLAITPAPTEDGESKPVWLKCLLQKSFTNLDPVTEMKRISEAEYYSILLGRYSQLVSQKIRLTFELSDSLYTVDVFTETGAALVLVSSKDNLSDCGLSSLSGAEELQVTHHQALYDVAKESIMV